MGKKKKNPNPEGPVEAPANQTVFSEAGAAQGAAVAIQTADQIPSEVAELVTSTLKVLVAQRRLYGLSTTLTSITKAIVKALDAYVRDISLGALRDYVRAELEKMGYKIITAKVNYMGVMFQADTVILYRNFEEMVDMVRTGRGDTLRVVITTDGIDPLFDKMVNA
jgi:hypothetical protein